MLIQVRIINEALTNCPSTDSKEDTELKQL